MSSENACRGGTQEPPAMIQEVNERPSWDWPKMCGKAKRVTSRLGLFFEQDGYLSLDYGILKWFTMTNNEDRVLNTVIHLESAHLGADIVYRNDGRTVVSVLAIEDERPQGRNQSPVLMVHLGSAEEHHKWWTALATAERLARKLACEKRGFGPDWDNDDEEDIDDTLSTVSSASSGSTTKAAAAEKTIDVSQASQIRKAYEQVLSLIIRPPRANYLLRALGPEQFTFMGRLIVRRDFCVTNRRGLRVQASVWQPYWDYDPNYIAKDSDEEVSSSLLSPCSTTTPSGNTKLRWQPPPGYRETSQATLIYLHGNASCRVEALTALTLCSTLGLSLCAFDCAGSGQSDGDYVSLGHYESDDCLAVIKSLRRRAERQGEKKTKENIFKYGLWGRSMGAVTALLYGIRKAPDAACLVVDSAFSSLDQLCRDLVSKVSQHKIPRAAVAVALRQVRTSVKYRTRFDMRECDALAGVPSCLAPALFIHGREDDFIFPRHTDELFQSYGGKIKSLLTPPGNHNANRPSAVFLGIERFLKRHLPCRPLTKSQVLNMKQHSIFGTETSSAKNKSPTRLRGRLASTNLIICETKPQRARDDDGDFTLDDLRDSRGPACDNVYLVPPWKFALGVYGHDPTIRQAIRTYSERLPGLASYEIGTDLGDGLPPEQEEDALEIDDQTRATASEFVSGMSEERQRQAEKDIGNFLQPSFSKKSDEELYYNEETTDEI